MISGAASGRLEAWRCAGRTLEIDGEQVFLRVEGEGPSLLLLHAYPTASWGFHKVWNALAARYRLVALDLPGSGFSGKSPQGDYRLGRLASVVETVLADAGIAKLHMLAHGYGSSVAQELLARERFQVLSACFVSAGLFPEAARVTLMQRLLLSPLGPVVARFAPQPKRAFRRRLCAAFGARCQPTEVELDEIWQLFRLNQGQAAVPAVLCYLRERWRLSGRLVSALQRTPAPLALVCSAEDSLSGAPTMAAWRSSLPAAPLFELPGGVGHYPPLECPEAVLAAYTSFHETLGG